MDSTSYACIFPTVYVSFSFVFVLVLSLLSPYNFILTLAFPCVYLVLLFPAFVFPASLFNQPYVYIQSCLAFCQLICPLFLFTNLIYFQSTFSESLEICFFLWLNDFANVTLFVWN